MSTLAARPNEIVTVSCVGCGDHYEINARSIRRKPGPRLCRLCRSVKVRKPTQADYNYWLTRFSDAEIRDMAAAIWG